MMTAIRDFFPIDGARHSPRSPHFEVMGQGDKIGFFEYDDTTGGPNHGARQRTAG
jgi:hypothetical protein